MDRASFSLLEAEIQDRYLAVAHVYRRLRERQAGFPNSPEAVESVAYQIHNLYGAYEQLFETVAGFFENRIEGARYHAEMARRMKIQLEGVRPALLQEQTFLWVDDLRRFRHFFRHAYTAELDAAQVGDVLRIALQLEEPFRRGLDSFLAQLDPSGSPPTS